VGLLDEHVGEVVTIEGEVSSLHQAHVIVPVAGKRAAYVDVRGWGQVVCYVADALPAGRRLRLTGVSRREGGGPPGSKAADFVEYQLDVSRWEVSPAP
jgi:hypothetical protein